MAAERPALILLCGGKSSRMGTPKGLLPVGGQTLLEAQLERFSQFGNRAIVVIGHGAIEYQRALPILNGNRVNVRSLTVKCVTNPRPELGPFSSLRAGMEALDRGESAYILPVDVPCPGAEVFAALLKDRKALAAIPSHEGKRGHPVWLAPAFLERLREVDLESGEARLDTQLMKLSEIERATVPVADARIRLNLNTPEEWHQWMKDTL